MVGPTTGSPPGVWLGGEPVGLDAPLERRQEHSLTGGMAAVAFAGLLVVIMRSDEVRGILTGLIRRALTVS